MKLIKCIFFVIVIVPISLFSQKHSYNGYILPVKDTIRAFFVFAELTNHQQIINRTDWESGKLPGEALRNELVDQDLANNPDSIKGWFTKYYYQMSFGNLIMLGDYYHKPVMIDYEEFNIAGFSSVIRYFEQLPKDSIKMLYGTDIEKFDVWDSNMYQKKEKKKNGKIDLFIIIWRKNINVKHEVSGFALYNQRLRLDNFSTGIDYMIMCNSLNRPNIRHEINHAFLGNNDFHSAGGGAGYRTNMSNHSGYGLLSLSHAFSIIASPWDRRRLDWNYPNNKYQISARDSNYYETNADIECVQNNFFKKTLTLRDYITYGDAIRIKIPYIGDVRPDVKHQWLWLVNHQKIEGNFDIKGKNKKGIYGHIQIGVDDFDDFRPSTNYLVPITSYGNFDYLFFDTTDNIYKAAYLYSNRENSFTGANHLQQIPLKYKDNKETIYRDELVIIKGMYRDGDKLPDSLFFYQDFPGFGNALDAFNEGDNISISTNPSPTGILTYINNKRRRESEANFSNKIDNRHIYINGLNISILKEHNNGDIDVMVEYNHPIVENNVRWCGQIELYENLKINERNHVVLDYGRTTQLPSPIAFVENEKIYADTTFLHCKPNSSIELNNNSKITIKNYSKFIADSASTIKMNKKSKIKIETGSSFEILKDATLEIDKKATIKIDKAANVYISDISIFENKTDIDFSEYITPLKYSIIIKNNIIKKSRF
jgi:hypothetical protein